ncbi:MAG: PAS domain S-box protein [Nitrospira sp.]|nr:PAS domain S-box protein [Nitrospira sp.]
MTTPLDPDLVTTNDHTSLPPETELAQLRARVAELEQRSAERTWKNDALEALAFDTAAATGREFLQALVRQLALALDTQYAFVTEWVPGRTDRLRTVAGWSGNCAADPLEINLHDSPCQQVMKDGTALFAQGIRQVFPQNTLLSSIGVESYMGVVLRNSEGQPTGHLCVMGVTPFLFDASQGTAILNVFARRAAAEIERLLAEETLKTSEEQFRAIVESATDAIILADHAGRIISWNNASERIFGYSMEEALGQPLTILMPARYRSQHEQGLARMGEMSQSTLGRKMLELVGITKEGREFPLELSLACWRSRDGLFFSGIIRDISERTRAETALKASDQRYQFLYENNPSMYFTLAQEGTILAVNQYGANQLGYNLEELIGHSILRLFDAHDHQTVLEQLSICASNPTKLFHWEIQKIRKSGVRIWVREHALAIQDETGTTVILVVCEDITAHKQVELRLQKINACFLRFGSDPLANINRLTALGGELLGGTCALYSRLEGTLLRSIGQWQTPPDFNPVDQADGHLCADLIKKGDDHLCTVRHLANTSYVRTDPNVSRYQLQTYVGQIVIRGKDPIGSLCVVFQHDFVPTEADEGLMGILASAIETEEERMQAQEALRTSEVQWRQFVADAPVGLVIMDNQQRLLSANKTFCDLTGYSEREVVGNTYALYTHPDDLPDNLILTNAFFEDTRSSYTYEKRYIRKSGDIIWVAVTTTGIELPGHTGPLMLAVVEDISERKRVTEERERISQDLHDDVLQSLYAVGMGLEHMRQRISRISPTNARRLDGSVTQLNGVIRQVRSFIPRMQTPAIQQGAFDQALLAIVQSLTVAGAGDIELAIDKSVADGLSRTQCGPVLSIAKEALSNSLRHAGDAHRRITVQLYRGKFRLEVFDDGKGFSPTARKSSGMGLANMRARARKLGARLTIRSRPKKGTQVVLDIPLPAPQATA